MRGEKEQRCFDIIKKFLEKDIYFAMSCEDEDIIKTAFKEAVPNPELNDFPDFIYSNGFIEHFQVTSSKENRKGSTMMREENDIARDFQNRAKVALEDNNVDEVSIKFIETPIYSHKSHSYIYFIDSFKRNFSNHMDSLNEYDGPKENKIFLIEYTDATLRMSKRYPEDLMMGVSYGDLFVRENLAYRLSRDIEMLRYIYDQRNLVDYVMFVNDDSFCGIIVDVIKTQNALEIIKLLHEGYDFHCAMKGSSQVGTVVSVPNKEGD